MMQRLRSTSLPVVFFVLSIFLSLVHIAFAQGSTDNTTVSGRCEVSSFTAKGASDSDLTQRQSQFLCDTAVVTLFSDFKGHMMIQFIQKANKASQPLAFAGHAEKKVVGQDDRTVVNLDTVYFTAGHATPINRDGTCTFFVVDREVSKLLCTAIVDEGKQRSAAVVVFTPYQAATSPIGPNVFSATSDSIIILSTGEKWQRLEGFTPTIYVQINGRYYTANPPLSTPQDNSRYGFVTSIVTDLIESDVVGAPQSVVDQIEGNCDTKRYSILGSLYYAGKARSGSPIESLPAENVERRLIIGSPLEKAFDLLCKVARQQQ